MNVNKILYYLSTGILTFIMLFSAYNYFFNHEAIANAFTSFGYPTYIIYPLAIVKLLGLVAVWTRISPLLMEWAYAGFFYNVVLAFFAHYYISDGQGAFSAIALVAIIVSRYMETKVFE